MLKRDYIQGKHGLLTVLILFVLLLAVCAPALFMAIKNQESLEFDVPFAVVDEENSLTSRVCLSLVEDQAFMKGMLNVTETDRETALSGVENGSFAAALILPDGFTEKVLTGIPNSGYLYISDALSNESELVSGIADMGAKILLTGQNAVFAGQELMEEAGTPNDAVNAYLDGVNGDLIDFAITEYENCFSVETVYGNADALSVTQYYAACWFVFVLFLCGVLFPRLYTEDCKKQLYARLRSDGLSHASFILPKVIWTTLLKAFMAAVILFALSFFFKLNWTVSSVLCTAVFLATSSLMTACFGISLSKKSSWVMLFIAILAAGLVLCGGLVPRSMLPVVCRTIGDYSPLGASVGLISGLFGGKVRVGACIAVGIYCILTWIFAIGFLNRLPVSSEERYAA